MTREEVKVVFTGVAHDHLMASSQLNTPPAPHQTNRAVHDKQENHSVYQRNPKSNDNHLHQPRTQLNCGLHHHQTQHQHYQHNSDRRHATQPLGGNSIENLPRQNLKEPLQESDNGASPFVLTPEQLDTKPSDNASALSTIAILRRLTMYDSLVLVKKYRACLNGFSLEFPTSNDDSRREAPLATSDQHEPADRKETSGATENTGAGQHSGCCGRTKLVSVYLDGDDPIYQGQQNRLSQQNGATGHSESHDGEIVYVPVNGLLDRLENYDRHGIAIDSRVYAFAMGLKTAERFLSSVGEKEIQEAPPF